MALLRSAIDKTLGIIYKKDEYESKFLRKYFKDTYQIDVGLYTIGVFDRWRIPPGTRIGRYCSIARSARLLNANHPINAISTHPYFYLPDFKIVHENKVTPVALVIEDDVWIGHNAIVTPECHRIGRGAVIGAGAVVMSDVAPYAVIVGAPGRLARFRFDSDTIALLEASRWWTFDRSDLAAFSEVARDFLSNPSRATAPPFFEIASVGPMPNEPDRSTGPAVADELAQRRASNLKSALIALAPRYTDAHARLSFSQIGLDSFGMIELRLTAEQLLGRQIRDSRWGFVHTPDDFFALAESEARQSAPRAAADVEARSSSESKADQKLGAAPDRNALGLGSPPVPVVQAISIADERTAAVSRKHMINMPQMSQRGLSESWLFKELGDIHWQALTQGLGTESAAIADSEGNRLYATFTRIKLDIPRSLRYFKENSFISIELNPSRFGAGMFFGEVDIESNAVDGKCHLMTSFSKFGESGSNTSLLKGQPLIPESCAIRSLPSPPAFVNEYRSRRANNLNDVLFETSYDILPPHDINGVGLLYFAAYPIITDLCAMQWKPHVASETFSTTMRDVYYFANAKPDEKLVFKMHDWIEDDNNISYISSISRASDNVVMSQTHTKKVAIA